MLSADKRKFARVNIKTMETKATKVVFSLFMAVFCAVLFVAALKPARASATVNRQINFQGKIILNSNSTNIPNGVYNMQFKIYSGGDGVLGGGDETLLWTEDRLRNASQGVTITDGIFQVNLGSVTALPGSVDFNNSTLWLSMNLGSTAAACTPFSSCSGDGEMSPFVRFTAAPYAFNSDTLDGIDSTAFGQLSSNQTWTGTNTLQPTTNITTAVIKQTSVGSPTADILNLQTANATNILQVTGPAANEAAVTLNSVGATRDLTLDSGSGTLKLGSNTTTLQKSGTAFTFDLNNGSNSTLTVTNAGSGIASLSVEGGVSIGSGQTYKVNGTQISSANLSNDSNLAKLDANQTFTGTITLQNASNSTSAFSIKTAGGSPDTLLTADTSNNRLKVGNDTASSGADTTLLVVDSAASSNQPTGVNGGIYYDTSLNKFQCYQNNAWSDCLTNVVYASSSSTHNFVSGLANVAASSTGVAVETLVFTSATAVSNTAGATGFTAPANGSFRSCLIKNNANITAGTLSLRWRVNGTSVGSPICTMDSTAALRRQSTGALDAGTVTFSAGDTIGIAFDTDAGFLPTGTNDYTVYWSVDYNATSGSALNLQYVYDSSSSPALITTSNAKDLQFGLSDTASDSNFLINAASGSTGKFAVQNSGTDVFSVTPSSGIILSPTTGNTITSSLGAGSQFVISNSTTPTVDLLNVTNIFQPTTTNGVDAQNIAFFQGSGAGISNAGLNITVNTGDDDSTLYGIKIDNQNNSTGGTQYGFYLSNSNQANNAITEALIALVNDETTASTVTDGINISGSAGGGTKTIVDGIDVSDDNITNAINVGSNIILGGSAIVDFTNFDVSANGGITVAIGQGLDVNAAGALNIGTTNASSINIGNASGSTSVSVLCGTGACGFGNNATAHTTTLGSVTGASATTLQAGTGGIDISSNLSNISLQTFGGGAINLTTGASGNLVNILTGNLKVGNGTPILTQDGEDVYIEGTLEVGGNVQFSGQTLIKPTTDSNTAFQIADSSGTASVNISTAGLALTNLVPFPSFENGNSNGWTVHGTGTGASVAASTDFANAGSYSLKLITGTTASGAEYRYPLKASTQYSLTFWARLSSGSSAASEFNAGRNDNPGSLGTATGDTNCTTSPDISAVSAVTTTWTQYSCTFTTGATIGPSSNFYIKQNDTTTSTLYIDGVTLVQASSGLTFTPVATGLDFNNYTESLFLNGNASGELQPWRLADKPVGATSTTDTTNRVFGHEGSATITANGYVYVLGGYNGTNTLNGVWYAKVNADGSVGTWSCQGTAAVASCGTSASPTNANGLPAARRLLTTVLANGYIYAIGGFDGSASVATVYYAKLNGDGSTGIWQTNTYAIGQGVAGTAQARVAPSATVLNGYIYVAGGCSDAATATCATPQNTIYYAKVNADGSTNAWTANANTLTAAKGMGTIAIANGYMYYIGGATNATTISANVYCAAINSDGSIGSFATTSCNSLPSSRAQQSTFVLNGFLYVIGGCSVIASGSCSTATNTVWYAPLNGDGTLGTWVAASNTLPANRGASSFFSGNSYLYMIGGYDASARQATVYYTSTPRTFIAGGLDLIGLNSQTTSDSGGGGNLTAGNTSIVGALRVDGYADFNNGISVDSALNVNAVSATAGQTIFNINNSNANSIFNVRHMGTNFGSLVTGGAFMQKNSYFGEEFNISPVNASQTCLANATSTNIGWSRGDIGSHNNAAVTCGTSADQFSGEFNWGTKNGAATAGQGCTVAYQNGGTVNGVERISAASTATASNSASCTEVLAATRTTSNKIFLAANLPVATYKVKASTLTASQNTDRIRIGLSNVNDATGLGSPTDGIYFSNCSTESTTTGSVSGCSNTTWYGHSFSGSAEVSGGPVTCSTGSGANALTSNFSYLRIEVRATNDVHFYADYNTSDGINEVECGTGIATTSTAAALTTWTHVTVATNAARTVAADIDYIRIWQDDNIPVESVASENTTETPSGQDIVTAPPLTLISTNPEDPNTNSDLYSFSAATSEDATFGKDVYIKGTLFADKIVANKIEGLEILTDKINSLSAAQKNKQKDNTSPVTTALATNQDTTSNLDTVTIKQASVTLNLDVGGTLLAGGLTLNGPAEFNGESIFNKLVTFVSDTEFIGRATFNNDSGGFATIYPGQQEVKITFKKEYADTPVVTASIRNGQFAQYAIKELDPKGFTIVLKDPAENETQFTWTALSVKDAKTAQVLPAPSQ